MFDCCIIGAGASGLLLGTQLPSHQKKIILEKSEKIGTKILLSGKGRCNFTNLRVNRKHYIGDKTERLTSLFQSFGPQEMRDLLEKNGIKSQEEDYGRILLKSNKSQELVDFLIKKNLENGTEILTNKNIISVEKKADHFIIQTADEERTSKKIVICTGGKSFPKVSGSDFIFGFAKKHGLQIKTPAPALCGISSKENLSSLSGSSIFAKIQIKKKDTLLYQEEGIILFTHRGISGPLIFNASLHLGYQISDFTSTTIKLQIPKEQMTKRLFNYLKAPKNLKSYTMSIHPSELRSRDEAKVMSGGLLFDEVDDNFELKKIPGIFVLGEALNITGETGGFNLQWCRSSAIQCGKHLQKQDK